MPFDHNYGPKHKFIGHLLNLYLIHSGNINIMRMAATQISNIHLKYVFCPLFLLVCAQGK